VLAVAALIAILSPEQIVGVPAIVVIVTFGVVFTVTVTVVLSLQPPLLPITV
jgi:hypothetical protein